METFFRNSISWERLAFYIGGGQYHSFLNCLEHKIDNWVTQYCTQLGRHIRDINQEDLWSINSILSIEDGLLKEHTKSKIVSENEQQQQLFKTATMKNSEIVSVSSEKSPIVIDDVDPDWYAARYPTWWPPAKSRSITT